MSWTDVADGIGTALLFAGALLCLAAAIGLLRFRDLLSRMHASTKPQVLGVLLVVVGLGLRLRSPLDIGMLLLVVVFQLLTVPVSGHMVSRAAFRTGLVDRVEGVAEVKQDRDGDDDPAADEHRR
ncbi:MAG TPA: monovalent cation/H(+) antiporter subunit G [Segeticoccus sp.]|jgi:multicomponent Na+:H+ antiporter subunit G|nr:monovalent cation/H(+) antiporter subunit G [Segeticoccus sp.]